MNKQSYVYILFSKRNGTLYVGVTSNLIKRVYEHKNKFVDGFTKKYNVDKLGYFFDDLMFGRNVCVQDVRKDGLAMGPGNICAD